MSDWQTIYAVAFMVAFVLGRPERWVVAVMAVNFLGSSALGADLLLVGILDLICVTVLIGQSREGNIVAALYVLMLPIYVAASHFGWGNGTTGGIVEAIGYVQILVATNVLGGLGGRNRPADRRRLGSVGHLAGGEVVARQFAAQGVARDPARNRQIGG
jgi:hypothetical protein